MKFFSIFIVALLLSFNAKADVAFEAGVNVEETASSSAEAKKNAMNKAYREAFLKVASQIVSDENVKVLGELTDEQILHFINEVQIIAEKSGTNSYRADLNIKIKENLLKQYCQENNMLEESLAPSRVLILPVFSDTEYKDKVLWEDGNVWRASWLEKGIIKSGSLDFEVIKDTPQNKNLVNVDNASFIDNETYKKLSMANGVKNIFTINAIRAGNNTLVVNIKSFPLVAEKSFIVNQKEANVFDAAIEQSVSFITAAVQNKVVDSALSQGGTIEVVSHISLKEWLNMEKKLKSIAQIKKVSTNTFGGGKTSFLLEFSGSYDALVRALAQEDMHLQAVNGVYIIK